MSESIGYDDIPAVNEIDEIITRLCQSGGTCGDSKNEYDSWSSKHSGVSKDIDNFNSDKVEIKLRNAHSMIPGRNPICWSPRQTVLATFDATSALEIIKNEDNLEEKCCTPEKEARQEDYFDSFREYLVDYQESKGIPRREYPFTSLMKVMGLGMCHTLVSIFYVIVNIPVLLQLFLLILRFILDKFTKIRKTGYNRLSIVQVGILAVEMICIYICLVFIIGFTVIPTLRMVIAILAKILLLN